MCIKFLIAVCVLLLLHRCSAASLLPDRGEFLELVDPKLELGVVQHDVVVAVQGDARGERPGVGVVDEARGRGPWGVCCWHAAEGGAGGGVFRCW